MVNDFDGNIVADKSLKQSLIHILYDKAFINNMLCVFEEEKSLLNERCEVVDLSEKTNLSEVAEKMFELVDEKIFYKPFTFLVQNLFVLLTQTYLLHCMTVSDSMKKEEIICNRIGSYIKLWLNIEEDREVVTTAPTLSKIINEKIQYETFKELQKLY